MTRRLAHSLLGLTLVLLAACGGSAGGPGGQGTPAASSDVAATAGSGSTPGGGTGGGTGTTGDACSLVTVDEARGAEQLPSQQTLTPASDGASCAFMLSDGTAAMTILVEWTGGTKRLATYDTSTYEPISGVGDQAFYDNPSTNLLMLVGDALVTIHSEWVQQADPAKVALSGLGRIVASRLTTGRVPAELEITPPPVVNAGSACDLLTADALAAIVKQGAMASSGDPNLPQYCYFTIASTGVQAVSIRLQAHAGADAWDSNIAGMQTDPVSGIGDKAAWSSFDQSLMILQHESIIQVTVLGLGLDADAALAIAKPIGAAAVANL